LNDVKINGDHVFDPVDPAPEFVELFSFVDSADITATKERMKLKIDSKGLRTTLDGVRNARFAGNRIRQRFLKPPIETEVQTLFSKRMLEVGDIVGVTHRSLPDMDTGLRGWTLEQCEVTRAVPDFRKGLMRFTLITTNFGTRYRVIAPTLFSGSPFPNYTAQTQAQKDRYCSIADTPTDLFTNGDAAHQII
jgi:hypothetical protein